MKKDFAKQVADEIIASLEEGLPVWRKSWAQVVKCAPHNGKTKKSYRGMNAWWLACVMRGKGYGDPRFFTFKQVNEMGGKVKKGQHGVPVEYWLWHGGNVLTVEDENGEKDTIVTKPFSVKHYTVFNAEQCDGIKQLEDIAGEQEWAQLDEADAIMQASGIVIKHNQAGQAFYSPLKDEICLPPKGAFKSAEDYYATALHELVHATGHETRCGRNIKNKFGDDAYAMEELRAEIGCLMLCAKLGINPPEQDAQHKAYIKHWLGVLKDNPSEIFKAANDAEKAVDWLMSKVEEVPLAA